MLKLHQKFRQIYTRSGDIYDMPPSVTKEQISQLVTTNRFIDVGDELLPVDQIKSIKLNTVTDSVDLMLAGLKEPIKSKARCFVKERRNNGRTVNTQILQNFLNLQ